MNMRDILLDVIRPVDPSAIPARSNPGTVQASLQQKGSPTDDAGTAGVVSSTPVGDMFRQFAIETFLPAFAPRKPQDERALAELHLGKPIVTTHVYPPIPCRSHDWCAYPEGEEEDGHYGWGRTEDEAVAELIEMLRDNERIPEA